MLKFLIAMVISIAGAAPAYAALETNTFYFKAVAQDADRFIFGQGQFTVTFDRQKPGWYYSSSADLDIGPDHFDSVALFATRSGGALIVSASALARGSEDIPAYMGVPSFISISEDGIYTGEVAASFGYAPRYVELFGSALISGSGPIQGTLVPVPAALPLMASGLAGISGLAWRRRRSRTRAA